MENLELADALAQTGKQKQKGVILHNANRQDNIERLHQLLTNHQFKTSKYNTFKVYEPKERTVYKLPYYPDRIVHHAILNVLEPVFVAAYTADTYSCIKGRGVHAALKNIKHALKDEQGTQYCLKLDIKKFYPSINHAILKTLLRKKFKDQELLQLLDGIIDSAPGLPIGNYLSQYLANFYLTYFDHWLKEVLKVKYYFRYADDIVILSGDKAFLHKLLANIRLYLDTELKLEVKDNYQIFLVNARGIDFLGYVFRHKYIKLRKRTKKRFARMLKRNKNPASIASYLGWAKHCDARHLVKTLMQEAA